MPPPQPNKGPITTTQLKQSPIASGRETFIGTEAGAQARQSAISAAAEQFLASVASVQSRSSAFGVGEAIPTYPPLVGVVMTGQLAQGASASGGIVNPPTTGAEASEQFAQAAIAAAIETYLAACDTPQLRQSLVGGASAIYRGPATAIQLSQSLNAYGKATPYVCEGDAVTIQEAPTAEAEGEMNYVGNWSGLQERQSMLGSDEAGLIVGSGDTDQKPPELVGDGDHGAADGSSGPIAWGPRYRDFSDEPREIRREIAGEARTMQLRQRAEVLASVRSLGKSWARQSRPLNFGNGEVIDIELETVAHLLMQFSLDEVSQ